MLVVGVRPGAVVFLRVQDELGDGVDSDARRDLAGGVAAHAIGDEKEAGLLLHEERILVVLPLPADVRQSLCLDVHEHQRFPKSENPPFRLPPWLRSSASASLSLDVRGVPLEGHLEIALRFREQAGALGRSGRHL